MSTASALLAIALIGGSGLVDAAIAGAMQDGTELPPPAPPAVNRHVSTASSIPLDSLRILYHRAVEDPSARAAGEALLERIGEGAVEGSAELEGLLEAYGGALHLLRARDGWWPPTRLSQLREGMRRLDDAVGRVPDGVEIRYLRLAAELHLPALFRRDEVAQEDRARLHAWMDEGGGLGEGEGVVGEWTACMIRAFVEATSPADGVSNDPPVPSLQAGGGIPGCPPPG